MYNHEKYPRFSRIDESKARRNFLGGVKGKIPLEKPLGFGGNPGFSGLNFLGVFFKGPPSKILGETPQKFGGTFFQKPRGENPVGAL